MKAIITFTSLVAALAIYACGGPSTDTTSSSDTSQEPKMEETDPQSTGSWREADINNEVLKEAVNAVLSEMNTSGQLARIISAREQVVKGMNYDINFELDNGEQWNVIVYRDLDGSITITKRASRINANEQRLAGGWNQTDVNSDLVKGAVNAAISEMDGSPVLARILEAKQQVVNGTNYDVTFELKNGETWNAVVYRDRSGNYSLPKPPTKI